MVAPVSGAASDPAALSLKVANTVAPRSVPTGTVAPSPFSANVSVNCLSLLIKTKKRLLPKLTEFTKVEFSGSLHCWRNVLGTKLGGSEMVHASGKPKTVTVRGDPS